MFKYFLFFLFCINVFGCTHEYRRVSFKSYVHYSKDKDQKVKYTAQLPIGFKPFVVMASGEYGTDNEYRYPDSSIIYISDNHLIDVNHDNIDKAGLWSKRFTYSKITAQSLRDTFKLEGKDSKGLYWKEVFIGKICIGYHKVKNEKKDAFDKAIASFKGRHRWW